MGTDSDVSQLEAMPVNSGDRIDCCHWQWSHRMDHTGILRTAVVGELRVWLIYSLDTPRARLTVLYLTTV
jgi:hypothetical protein